MKFAITCVSGLACAGFCFGQEATRRSSGVAGPAAIATNADVSYCFARERGLDPERLPPAYLVLQLRVRISYRNAGTRPLILPLEHERTIYTGFKLGEMSVFRDHPHLFDPPVKVMKRLPDDVSPESPITPKNDVFTVIPAGGEMAPLLLEEITLPVDRTPLFRKYPDLRGRKVYLKLQFAHQKLSSALDADLSDRWSRFGVPWTGTLTTNAILIDVPAAPKAGPCVDIQTPAHPVKSPNDQK